MGDIGDIQLSCRVEERGEETYDRWRRVPLSGDQSRGDEEKEGEGRDVR